jgi:hypothetical protein
MQQKRNSFYYGYLFLGLGISTLGMSQVSFAEDGITYIRSLQLPCSSPNTQMGLERMGESLPESDSAKGSFKRCAELFGKCERDPSYFTSPNQVVTTGDSSDGFPTSPGIRAQIKDGLVRQVIRNRIQNLYLGINRVADTNTPVQLKRSQLWRPSSNDTIAACNIFAKEGPATGDNTGLVAIDQMGSIVTMPAGVDTNNGARAPKHRAPHNTAKRSMFNFGERGTAYKEAAPQFIGIGALARGSEIPAAKSCGNWPSHLVNFSSESKICKKKNEPTQVRKGEDTRTHIDNVIWDDGSSAAPGTEECNIHYYADYHNASAISSLQTGALVQATWMKLDEVLQEVHNGDLHVNYDLCRNYALSYHEKIKSAVEALDSSKACGRNFKQVLNGCKVDKDGKFTQSDCYIASLITTLQASGYVQVAECEVYKRAHDLYGSMFIDTPGKAYANQLKNWASMGCMAWANLRAGGGGHGEPRARELSEYLGTCFPKTYAIAFKNYLTTNPLTNGSQVMKEVPIQKQMVNSNESNYLGRATAGYNGEVLKDNGEPFIKVNNGVLFDSSPNSSAGATTSFNTMYPLEFETGIIQERSLTTQFQEPSWLFGFSFLSLGLVAPKRRKKRKVQGSKLTAQASLLALFLVSAPAFGSMLPFGESRMHVAVKYSCVGFNGVLLTGKQAEKCCSYKDELAATGPEAKEGDGAQSDSADVNCPGDPDEVLEDLSIRAASTGDTEDGAIRGIRDLASNNAGLSANSILTGVENPAAEGQTNPYSTGHQVFSAVGKDSAATAVEGGMSTRNPAGGTTSGAEGGKLAGLTNNGNGAAGGGAGGGNSNSGGLGSLQSGSDPTNSAANADAARGAAGAGNDAALGGGAFASGGGGGFGGGGMGRPNGDVDPSRIEWGLGQGQGQDAQGSRGSGSDNEVTSISEDPEDYFTRINIEDNIFKKVETIYRQKTPPLLLESIKK